LENVSFSTLLMPIRIRLSILMPIPIHHASLHCFVFLVSVKGSEMFWKNYSVSLHLVEIDTVPYPSPDPDRQALDADPYPDPAK
jgi:hypothetical protein